MKANIIYIEGWEKSEAQMRRAETSVKRFGLDYDLIPGVTPDTLNQYLEKYPLEPVINSRAWDYTNDKQPMLETKQSCFLNHVMFWERVVEADSPMMFLEHDALMVREWTDPTWDEVLILNMDAAVKHNHNLNKNYGGSYIYENEDYCSRPLDYDLKYWKENRFKGGCCAPGTASYAITPKGAKRLLTSFKISGWDQSDFFINTNNVNIEYSDPQFFEFSGANIKSSKGFSYG